MKLQVLKECEVPLYKILAADLPVKVSLQLTRDMGGIIAELKIYEEVRNKLIKKHGEEQPDGSMAVIKPEAVRAFNKEHGELLEQEIEVKFKAIPIADLENERFAIRPLELYLLIVNGFVVEATEKKEKSIKAVK